LMNVWINVWLLSFLKITWFTGRVIIYGQVVAMSYPEQLYPVEHRKKSGPIFND